MAAVVVVVDFAAVGAVALNQEQVGVLVAGSQIDRNFSLCDQLPGLRERQQLQV